jgi:hypothetical protein
MPCPRHRRRESSISGVIHAMALSRNIVTIGSRPALAPDSPPAKREVLVHLAGMRRVSPVAILRPRRQLAPDAYQPEQENKDQGHA